MSIHINYGLSCRFVLNQDLRCPFNRKRLAETIGIKNIFVASVGGRNAYDLYNMMENGLDDNDLSFNDDRNHHFRQSWLRARLKVESQAPFNSFCPLFVIYPANYVFTSHDNEKRKDKKKCLTGKVKRCSFLPLKLSYVK